MIKEGGQGGGGGGGGGGEGGVGVSRGGGDGCKRPQSFTKLDNSVKNRRGSYVSIKTSTPC